MIKLNAIESAVILVSKGWTPKNYEPYKLVGHDVDNVDSKHTFLYCEHCKIDKSRAVYENLVNFMLKCGVKFKDELNQQLVNTVMDSRWLLSVYRTSNPDRLKLFYDTIYSFFQELDCIGVDKDGKSIQLIEFDYSLIERKDLEQEIKDKSEH